MLSLLPLWLVPACWHLRWEISTKPGIAVCGSKLPLADRILPALQKMSNLQAAFGGTTTDENNRPPQAKGRLQGGGAWKFANLPLTPSLCKEGERVRDFINRANNSVELFSTMRLLSEGEAGYEV